MSHTRTALLLLRILLFVALGIMFILYGMGMEINHAKALFIGIGVADFVYAGVLGRCYLRGHRCSRE